ncbi:MAG: hypothetical protein HDR88_14205 [Bacteroides sp.]|nr:hypothetical protein [Bacteroides sp.]
MKSIKAILPALFLSMSAAAMGQQIDRLGVTDINVEKADNGTLDISMTIKPSLCHLRTSQLLKVVPVIYSTDSLFRQELPEYSIAGKNQYYYTIRSNDNPGLLYRSGSHTTDTYSVQLPWQDWMEQSTVALEVKTTTCCGAPVSDEDLPIIDIDLVPPVMALELDYVAPIASGTKDFKLEGSAYVNFPVNKTAIYPDYMNNPMELKKITNSIDTVRANPDATITGITLTGYASPEGPYQNNVRLAEGRTQAVKEYVSKLYDFPASVYTTASVPEDWAGLRASIEKSSLPLREQMINFIDSDYPIEQRNDRFRQLFPQDYPWLLKNVYPWLRHTDYLIKYTVRSYTDPEEIKKVLATRPQNLTLDEIYTLAQSYPVGSDEYNEVFEVAVRMFPDEPLANLNAANTAISKGDFVNAERFLLKAGDTPEADYARGMMYAKKKDYPLALSFLRKANTPKAMEAIEQIEAFSDFKGSIKFRDLDAESSEKN